MSHVLPTFLPLPFHNSAFKKLKEEKVFGLSFGLPGNKNFDIDIVGKDVEFWTCEPYCLDYVCDPVLDAWGITLSTPNHLGKLARLKKELHTNQGDDWLNPYLSVDEDSTFRLLDEISKDAGDPAGRPAVFVARILDRNNHGHILALGIFSNDTASAHAMFAAHIAKAVQVCCTRRSVLC